MEYIYIGMYYIGILQYLHIVKESFLQTFNCSYFLNTDISKANNKRITPAYSSGARRV